ncbi:peptidoglycan recognition protein [Streptomyces sp. RTd22]|uniref:peptidoglycan recognition protein family protein n=1 Tax=Streptomyces sp. RTd22 TaxID=1841249 RepID=UPI0007C583FF|nr:peptidoglycan recognition protein [Streptomyces sp. RTd22]
MRGFLASSVGVVCTAALTLPSALGTAHARADHASLMGGTQSLPLRPLGLPLDRGMAAPGGDRGLAARDVPPFSLVGVVWDDASDDLRGQVQVRTRAARTGTWSAWRDLRAYHDDAPDPAPGASDGGAGHPRGGTAPLWVGDSDGVQARVRAARPAGAVPAALPAGMRLELVNPGAAPAPPPAHPDPAHPDPHPAHPDPHLGHPDPHLGHPDPHPGHAIPHAGHPSPHPTAIPHATGGPQPGGGVTTPTPRPATPTPRPRPSKTAQLPTGQAGSSAVRHTAPRPRIITRAGWGANEGIRESGYAYSKTVKAAFIHHTVTGNSYTCAQVPSVLRSIYRYHVQSMGWRDYGYNFTIDKCGNIYEGRAGGVTKAVLGAHTLGFNQNSMGVAVLGTYTAKKPSAKAVRAIAKLTAWKLGLFNRNPRGTTHLVSGGGNKYKKGVNVKLRVISGHRDGFATECPGQRLYSKLNSVRSTAARLQGR